MDNDFEVFCYIAKGCCHSDIYKDLPFDINAGCKMDPSSYLYDITIKNIKNMDQLQAIVVCHHDYKKSERYKNSLKLIEERKDECDMINFFIGKHPYKNYMYTEKN